jgi:hypothetical protein
MQMNLPTWPTHAPMRGLPLTIGKLAGIKRGQRREAGRAQDLPGDIVDDEPTGLGSDCRLVQQGREFFDPF